ncbi:KTSC domain-containing protein [Pedobacter sp. SYSU D00535]|uniref:KTSC domain-containing protein n=1 Tax=Pedobacter sp. SYSU D00535 TaxID=2810308 RepID=UPI001A97996F|nr:KTSC domain-containing protein [Pedobacter sp. SYSU D00535]
MRRGKLNSSNRLETPASGTTVYIDYSEKLRVLEVEFRGSRIYHYLNVEPQMWERYKLEVLNGGSSGTFVNTQIKPLYEYVELA